MSRLPDWTAEEFHVVLDNPTATAASLADRLQHRSVDAEGRILTEVEAVSDRSRAFEYGANGFPSVIEETEDEESVVTSLDYDLTTMNGVNQSDVFTGQ